MEIEHFIIVGGTTGSGRALVRRLSGRGQSVSLIGRHPSAEVEQQSPGVCFYPTELANAESARATIEKCIQRSGKLAHVIFYQRYRGKDDPWQGEIDVSLSGTKTVIELCVDHFDGIGNNSIVVLSSSASRFICAEQPVSYHVAKAALIQMVRYYAVILGPRGIRVNAVAPDTVVKDEMRQFYQQQHALRDLYENIAPLRRMGTADDVADVVEFLCSPQSSFITGQEIVVDGGISLAGHGALARRIAELDKLKITR